MTEKLNAFVCDNCSKCTGKGVDGYPLDNGWILVYENEKTEYFCSEECRKMYGIEK